MAAVPSRSATSSSDRILELDSLRGLAAVAVVLFHFTTRYNELFGHTIALPASVPWGHHGVDLFFMLSGFVILMTLDRQSDPRKFIWGRFTRLYPAYWAAVAVTFAVVACFGLPGEEVSLGQALVNGTMVQALLGAPHVDGAYWSLQAELLFYANMLMLYHLGAFNRPRWTVAMWVLLAIAIHVGIVATEESAPYVAGILNKLRTLASLKFIPLFAIGILIYQIRQTRSVTGWDWLLFLSCWAAVGLLNGLPSALVAVSLSAVLYLTVNGWMPALQCRPLVVLGALSYPLYLLHQNIGYVAMRQIEARGVTPVLALAVALVVAFILAGLLHTLVEKPALELLRSRRSVAGHRPEGAIVPA